MENRLLAMTHMAVPSVGQEQLVRRWSLVSGETMTGEIGLTGYGVAIHLFGDDQREAQQVFAGFRTDQILHFNYCVYFG